MSVMTELLREGLPIWTKRTKIRKALPGVVKSWETGGPTWVYVVIEVWTANPLSPGQTIKQTIRTNSRQISRRFEEA